MLCNIFYVQAAQNEGKTIFQVSAENLAESKVKLTVSVTKDSNISALSMELIYYSDFLQFQSSESGEIGKNGIMKINSGIENKIIATLISAEPQFEAGTLFSAVFTVLNNSLYPQIPVTLKVTEAVNSNYEALPFEIQQDNISNPYYVSSGSSAVDVKEAVTDDTINDKLSELTGKESILVTVPKDKDKNITVKDDSVIGVYYERDNSFSPVTSETNQKTGETTYKIEEIEKTDNIYIIQEKPQPDTATEAQLKQNNASSHNKTDFKYWIIIAFAGFFIILAVFIIINFKRRGLKQ